MKLLTHLKNTHQLPERVVATIGNFDGVHLGHQALITALRQQAVGLNCPTLVILFEPQPSEYFHIEKAPARLTGLREKLQMFHLLGVDYVCCLKFNKKLSQMAAADFAEQIIFKSLRSHYLLVGNDFHFGRERLGNVQLLKEIGQKYGATVAAFPDFMIANTRISSTSIRLALQQGNLISAATYLGRNYSLCGRVVRGAGLGRQWGIPTANIALHHATLPLSGVFNVEVIRQPGTIYRGVANVGRRPTVDGQLKLTLEVHLFDVNESLYGERLEIIFLNKLRDEKKFGSVQELVAQIHSDIDHAKALFR